MDGIVKPRVQSIEHAPKVDFESHLLMLFADEEPRKVLRQWHAGLRDLTESFYHVSDLDDCDIYTNFYRVTGVRFRDTLPTYTVEVDGKPLTMGDIAEQHRRVQEATRRLRDD